MIIDLITFFLDCFCIVCWYVFKNIDNVCVICLKKILFFEIMFGFHLGSIRDIE